MEASDDPYEILGIQPDTDEKEIKKAYRNLAMQFHPDKQHTEEDKEEAHNMFAKISAAYEVVSDPSKRRDWDMLRQGNTTKGRRRPTGARNSIGASPHRARSTTSPTRKTSPPKRNYSTDSSPPPHPPHRSRSGAASPARSRVAPSSPTRARTTGTNMTPTRQRSTNSPPPPRSRSPLPPPPSPGLFRSRAKRTASPGKARTTSPGRAARDRSKGRSPSPGVYRNRPRPARGDDHHHSSPPNNDNISGSRRRSSYTGPPVSPYVDPARPRARHSIASPEGNVSRGHVHAPASPGTLDGLRPTSPGTIRPQGRPRPRPIGQNGEQAQNRPRKHASTGTLKVRNSTGSISPRERMGSERPSSGGRQMSAGTLRRKFRDPFLIFEEVMEEEFGKGYKSKAASGWNKDDETGQVIGGAKKLTAKKEFKKLDLNGDKALSKDELRNLIESHDEMWAVLGGKLNLKRETCIRIATEVAFSLAKGEETTHKNKRKSSAAVDENTYELSESEFKGFYKNYVMSQKGSYDFFLRTIFAFYDINGDGVLQRDEFENFLDLFYKTKETYKQKMETMPSKQNLLRIAEARLDKNKSGTLSFEEVRDLLQVAVVLTE